MRNSSLVHWFQARKKFCRAICTVLCLAFVFELAAPLTAHALTAGPSAPEFSTFTPVGSSDLVDMFSGDFSYNVGLMDVGGYPINLAYATGASMEEEASWVGLGWSLNPGVINRGLQGLPDDFDGDPVTREHRMRHNFDINTTIGFNLEIFGSKVASDEDNPFATVDASFGVSYNNYRGIGFENTVNLGIKPLQNAGIGLNFRNSSSDGLDVSIEGSFSGRIANSQNATVGYGGSASIGYNNRGGLKSLDVGFNVGRTYKTFTEFKGERANQNSETAPLGSASHSFPLSSQVYSPPMINNSTIVGAELSASFGGEQTYIHPGVFINVSFTKQFYGPGGPRFTRPAYGYYYAENGAGNRELALQDFSREGDGPVTKNNRSIAIPFLTHDVYSASGHGISGAFLPRRDEIGVVSDPETRSRQRSLQAGVEFGFPMHPGGGGIDLGANLGLPNATTETGMWDAPALDSYGYSRSVTKYFRMAGESCRMPNPSAFNTLGGTHARRFKIQDNSVLRSIIGSDGAQVVNYNQALMGDMRNAAPRATLMQALTAKEASVPGVCLDADIKSYEMPVSGNFTPDANGQYSLPYTQPGITRIRELTSGGTNYDNESHFSEMRVTQPDGRRYVYGLPVYNNVQREYSFNVEVGDGITSLNPDAQLVDGYSFINSNSEREIETGEGLNHYYEVTETPAYVTHHLLTAVLSPDYVDVTGDGITPDDYGTAVRFNYHRRHQAYQWRSPYNNARYNYGLMADGDIEPRRRDDRASFVYGTKEVWYLHSIETRTHIAYFHISESGNVTGARADGIGVGSEILGGLPVNSADYQRLCKLDSISLYARGEFTNHGLQGEVLKRAHFRYAGYTYPNGVAAQAALCPSIPNYNALPGSNTGPSGKLTLTEIFFTYGASHKGRVSGYKFGYDAFNPAYNPMHVDRWGNYMPAPTGQLVNMPSFDNAAASELPNSINPYVRQNTPRSTLDQWARAWALTKIQTPSGAEINVEYEADDYAYVQDQQAEEFFQIEGLSESAGGTPEDLLYDIENSIGSFKIRNYIVVDVPWPSSNPGNYLDHYPINERIPFRFFVKVESRDDIEGWEYISGYVDIKSGGNTEIPTPGRPDYHRLYLQMKDVSVGINANNTQANDILRIAWNFAAESTPFWAYPGSYPSMFEGTTMREAGLAMQQLGNQYLDMFKSRNRVFAENTLCQTVIPKHSHVRLATPDAQKVGGGLRVKRILVTDNWENVSRQTDASNFTTGQEYVYRTVENTNQVISSGVAENEPLVGYDECALRTYRNENVQERRWAPNGFTMNENPIALAYMPPARVGYSQVQVRQIVNPEFDSEEYGPSGYEESRFYTAKDFPVRSELTVDVQSRPPQPVTIRNLILGQLRRDQQLVGSQAFSFVQNDMHGKPLSQSSFAAGQPSLFDLPVGFYESVNTTPSALSKTEYFYRTESGNPSHLSTKLPMIYPDGTVREVDAGLDWHCIIDSRRSYSRVATPKVRMNLETDNFGVFIILPILTAWGSLKSEKTEVKLLSVAKMVRQYGYLDRVVVSQEGSRVETRNLLWDSETGGVLLSSTQNEFADPVYSFSYPAHWRYDGMSFACINADHSGPVSIGTNGEAIFPPPSDIAEGDEVLLMNELFTLPTPTTLILGYAWVVREGSALILKNREGQPVSGIITTANKYKVVRSRRRNIAAVPIGSIAALANPIQTPSTGGAATLAFSNVLNANAAEFSEVWQAYCCSASPEGAACGLGNPYTVGILGNWRPKRQYTFLTHREQGALSANLPATVPSTDIRSQGVLRNFVPYWSWSEGQLVGTAAEARWQWSSALTVVDPFGNSLEDVDPLGRPSSVFYGYNNLLPVAEASNTAYRELGYDGYEDYSLTPTEFSWANPGPCNLPQGLRLYKYRELQNGAANARVRISREESHSGLSSLFLGCGTATYLMGTQDPNCASPTACAQCVPKLMPIRGKEYIISLWVKQPVATASAHRLRIEFLSGSPTLNFSPTGPVIEGWRRVYARFTVPQNETQGFRIQLVGSGLPQEGPVYFDDLRLHPVDGLMRSMAYHPWSLRLMAMMDENNYATFYEYDVQGDLVRIKRETERGVMTVQEGRNNMPRQNVTAP